MVVLLGCARWAFLSSGTWCRSGLPESSEPMKTSCVLAISIKHQEMSEPTSWAAKSVLEAACSSLLASLPQGCSFKLRMLQICSQIVGVIEQGQKSQPFQLPAHKQTQSPRGSCPYVPEKLRLTHASYCLLPYSLHSFPTTWSTEQKAH